MNNKTIKCKCGCGAELLQKDKYGRIREYVSGHNRRKHKKKYDYQNEWMKRNRGYINKFRQKKSRERKLELMSILNNKCLDCSVEYNDKNASIFDFHHLDESKKEISIGSNLYNVSLDKLKNEIKKCVLLCSNCHRIRHNGEW